MRLERLERHGDSEGNIPGEMTQAEKDVLFFEESEESELEESQEPIVVGIGHSAMVDEFETKAIIINDSRSGPTVMNWPENVIIPRMSPAARRIRRSER